MNNAHYTIGYLQARVQQPYAAVAGALQELGIEPSLIINNQVHYPAESEQAIDRHIREARAAALLGYKPVRPEANGEPTPRA
jgi:hypothetical protein